jgi:putative hydrolase of the HAD superfamily
MKERPSTRMRNCIDKRSQILKLPQSGFTIGTYHQTTGLIMASPPANPKPATPKVIFFDLDDTLFDRDHSWECGVTAVLSLFPRCAGVTPEYALSSYKEAIRRAGRITDRKRCTSLEAFGAQMRELFRILQIQEPDETEAPEMQAVLRAAADQAMRATPGTIDTLIRLRERGFRIGIITNGPNQLQVRKAEAIGVRHLVDHIITSEEAGCAKPDNAIFQMAIERFGAPLHKTIMVGDNVTNDIRGAQNAKLWPLLYIPHGCVNHRRAEVPKVAVINNMVDILSLLGISPRLCNFQSLLREPRLVIQDMRIDVPFVSRYNLWLPIHMVWFMIKKVADVIHCALNKKSDLALQGLQALVSALKQSRLPIGEESTLSLPHFTDEARNGTTEFRMAEREYSIVVQLKISFELDERDPGLIVQMAGALQGFCNALTRDDPRRALADLEWALAHVEVNAKAIDGIEELSDMTLLSIDTSGTQQD